MTSSVCVLRVGGGEAEAARDIHWHIAAEVWYLATDRMRQEIVWVGVEDKDGELIEYIDTERKADITPERIEAEKRLMDCMDCHNRATHIFRSPEEHIDAALAQGKIDSSLPFIKREGLKALDPPNPSLTQAVAKVEGIKEFYQTSYPQIAMEKSREIAKALDELKDIARLTTFPEMNVNWETYIDNSSHQESPGCLRCHGKLVEKTVEQESEKIDADCNLCHYFELP